MNSLWDYDQETLDTEVRNLDIAVPEWIEQDISVYDVAAVLQGGCESGAYMPAVTYSDAKKTMNDYEDEILLHLETCYDLSEFAIGDGSWSSLACRLVSTAVELWCAETEQEIMDAIEDFQEMKS